MKRQHWNSHWALADLVAELARDLADWPGDDPNAAFLQAHSEHRLMAQRVQRAAPSPLAEIQVNHLAADKPPIYILRCKPVFLGTSHFDPRSDKWVPISQSESEHFPDDINALRGLRQ